MKKLSRNEIASLEQHVANLKSEWNEVENSKGDVEFAIEAMNLSILRYNEALGEARTYLNGLIEAAREANETPSEEDDASVSWVDAVWVFNDELEDEAEDFDPRFPDEPGNAARLQEILTEIGQLEQY